MERNNRSQEESGKKRYYPASADHGRSRERKSTADKQYEFAQEIWFHQLVSPHRNHPQSAFRENEMQDEHLLLFLFGARRHSVPKLRKLGAGLSANHDPM